MALASEIIKMAVPGIAAGFTSSMFYPKEFAIIPMSRYNALIEAEQQLERYRNTKRKSAKRLRRPHKRHG
jgi:hypothetical protein